MAGKYGIATSNSVVAWSVYDMSLDTSGQRSLITLRYGAENRDNYVHIVGMPPTLIYRVRLANVIYGPQCRLPWWWSSVCPKIDWKSRFAINTLAITEFWDAFYREKTYVNKIQVLYRLFAKMRLVVMFGEL